MYGRHMDKFLYLVRKEHTYLCMYNGASNNIKKIIFLKGGTFLERHLFALYKICYNFKCFSLIVGVSGH